MIAIGVGFRKSCTAETLVGLVRRALAEAALDEPARAGSRAVLATVAEKDRPVLRAAAAALALPVVICAKDAMAVASDRITVASERVQACLGIPSVAEAAALTAAGPDSRLLVSRISSGDATCAVAVGGEVRP